MPFPLIPVLIGAGVSAWLGRKAHDKWGDHPPLRGYCSNCGKTSSHRFHQSGMSWKKTGATGVLLGAAGLGVSSLLARNIYKCGNCRHLTLQCRVPGCKGMALAGDYYDDEFCGECREGNDKSKLYQAMQDQKTYRKVKEVVLRKQQHIDALSAKIRELEKDRQRNKTLIRELNERLRQVTAEKRDMEKRLRR